MRTRSLEEDAPSAWEVAGPRLPTHDLMQSSPLVLIVGPTAVGKTEISIRLARRADAEIISADSRLFYRGMDVGTAKPSAAERQGIPHHLIDIADPDETVSLGLFQRLARNAIGQIQGRRRLPLLVGGTGQYVRAVTQGWNPPPVAEQTRLRLALRALAEMRGTAWLHLRLGAMDPEAAAAIDHRNVRRTIRALEVILRTGRKFSAQRGQGQSPYGITVLGLYLPRAVLYERIDQRIQRMFDGGLVQETERLLAAGYAPELPALSAIGYRECARLLRGEIQQAEAITEIRKATRAFVRRQANWFKQSDPHISWFPADDPKAIDSMEASIRDAMRETAPAIDARIPASH